VAFESGSHPRNIAHHDGGKECHLVGKARIDRRLPGASNIGDLVDAGARESAFDKRAAGSIENALIHLPGELPPRPADAAGLAGPAPTRPLFSTRNVSHGDLHVLVIFGLVLG
jgi:hypothetical protein